MRKVLLIFLAFVLSNTALFGQNISNEGSDFWAVFPTHVNSVNQKGLNLANIVVFVTSKFVSEVTVSCGSGYSETKVIPANTAVSFNVLRSSAYVNFDEQNTALDNRGIHIEVTPGKPKVSAYAHIYAGFRSAASLILPVESLGQTYFSMNYTQTSLIGNNFLTLVAVEDNTDLVLHKKNGAVQNINLAKAGDVYEYIDDKQDLTGVYVTTNPTTSNCKKFAAFSGSTALALGSCSNDAEGVSYDPLYQQLYPTVSAGKNYGVVPFKDRKYILRIVAQEDNTHITFNGVTYTRNKGQFVESPELIASTFITADRPISVAQYALSQKCSAAVGGGIQGDPDMVILNPIEFNIRNITVFSSDLEQINVKYINILIKANQSNSFKINGIKPQVTWQPLVGNADFAYAQILVYQKSLTLSADDGFNAIAYGFGDAESYAYSAGTNLASNNFLSVLNTDTKLSGPDGCVGENVDLNIVLPYKATSINWTFDDANIVVESEPKLVGTINANGVESFTYKSPYSQTFNESAKHKITADIVLENPSACFRNNITTIYSFSIFDLPTAKFDFEEPGCSNTGVQFTDKSVSNTADFSVTEWSWDFGDGTDPKSADATMQNPKHKFAKGGIYTVKLKVKSNTGCFSNVVEQQVKVSPAPIAKFEVFEKSCINADVVFTDKSTVSKLIVPDAEIVKWEWDFGDGVTESNLNGAAVMHKFSALGIYKVKLKVTTNMGCAEEFTKTIEIVDSPVANFTLPDYCINDGLAVFINTSKNIDETQNDLTYTWSFDKNNPSATSTQKDGKYAFPSAGDYLVTLSIKNEFGCEVSVTKTFTVNPQVSEANFEIKTKQNSCSDKQVFINNMSTISSGKILRIEVFKDYLNNPNDKITIPNPTGGDNIVLNYQNFGGSLPQQKTIRLVAYSGQNCFKEVSKIITLNPVPQLSFNPIPSVCSGVGSVLIDEAKEFSGAIGVGKYSGEGIDQEGNFNPKVAGVGSHIITYTFTTQTGCSNKVEQTITVNPTPTIMLPTQIFVLAGGQIEIPTSTSGDNLIYKWSPSNFLDHDDVENPIATPTEDITYTLTVSTENGCDATATVFVKVLESLEVANAFSPNGDGVNDVWVIKYLASYPNATVEVFNRNGSRVFFSKGYDKPFDGSYQNVSLPVGVYYYIINPNNGRKPITGPLTILK